MTKRKPSSGRAIWSELGLSRASDAEKAQTWREQLTEALGDFRNGAPLSPVFVPLISDMTEESRRTALMLYGAQALRKDVGWDFDSEIHAMMELLAEQIWNASKAQIINYAESYYRDAT